VIDDGFRNAVDDAYRRGDWDRLFDVLHVLTDVLEDDVAVACVGWCVAERRYPTGDVAEGTFVWWTVDYGPRPEIHDEVSAALAAYLPNPKCYRHIREGGTTPTDAYVALIDGWKRAVADGVSVDQLRGRVGVNS
jgi:hypothetical protein